MEQKHTPLELAAQDYANTMWGAYLDITYDESCNILSYGEVSIKDFKAGADWQVRFNQKLIDALNEAKEAFTYIAYTGDTTEVDRLAMSLHTLLHSLETETETENSKS